MRRRPLCADQLANTDPTGLRAGSAGNHDDRPVRWQAQLATRRLRRSLRHRSCGIGISVLMYLIRAGYTGTMVRTHKIRRLHLVPQHRRKSRRRWTSERCQQLTSGRSSRVGVSQIRWSRS